MPSAITAARSDSIAPSIAMAKAEGWYAKNGSKWKTMEDLMLRYRSAAFFARTVAPEVALGGHGELDGLQQCVRRRPRLRLRRRRPMAEGKKADFFHGIRGWRG